MSLGVLLLGCSLRSRLFCHVMPDSTATHRTQNRMMTGVMTGNAANECAFDAALGFGLNRCCKSGKGECRDQKNLAHLSLRRF
jgi:hypothetical protein